MTEQEKDKRIADLEQRIRELESRVDMPCDAAVRMAKLRASEDAMLSAKRFEEALRRKPDGSVRLTGGPVQVWPRPVSPTAMYFLQGILEQEGGRGGYR